MMEENGKIKIIEKDGNKYIDGEEVLCEYDLNVNYVKEILLFSGLMIFYMYIKSQDFDVNIVWWIFTFGITTIIVSGVIKDIKSSKINKLYLTNNYFITANGDKINLNNIFFKYKSYFDYAGIFCWSELLFYECNKFIFYTKVDKNNEEYKKFMDKLIIISGNKDVSKELQRYYAKRKLVQITGEKNGK